MLVALQVQPCATPLEISQISQITNPNSTIGGGIKEFLHRNGGFADFFESVDG
jgi:hypothetical protein